MTVNGPIEDTDTGVILPHEHVIVDFGGAETASPDRYDADEVVALMTPYMQEIFDLGVRTFVDCSPMYLARDPMILKRISDATGMHIITNTGQYKEPFLPRRTFEITAEELAGEWIREWEEGIGSTGIRPGFIKTAVHPRPLDPVQVKVMRAAALTSRATGLTIGTHTVKGLPALHILSLLESEGVDPAQWIFIHAHQEDDYALLRMVASRGAWIELDGIGAAPDEATLATLVKLLDDGFENQILLSHDAGWYTVGEPNGGTPRPYTHMHQEFLPLLRSFGISEKLIARLIQQNPAKAFAVTPT